MPETITRNNTIIVYSPGPSGKTAIRDLLRIYFNCHAVVDKWSPDQPLIAGALHLSNTPLANPPDYVTQLTCDQALELARDYLRREIGPFIHDTKDNR